MKAFKFSVLLMVTVMLLAPGCKKKVTVKTSKYAEYSNEELFSYGTAYAKKGRRVKARVYLEEIVKRGQDDMLTADATILLADTYYEQGTISSYADAIYHYRNLLRYFPKHRRADYCQYQVGLCYFEQRNSHSRDLTAVKESILMFRTVQVNYPDSLFVAPAKKKIRKCYKVLARHEFSVGRFYYKKSNLNAALKRFEVVLNRYSEFYEEPDLYYFMGQTLWDLSREKEGEFYFNKLIRRFPESKFAKEARARMNGKPSPRGFWDRVLPPYL